MTTPTNTHGGKRPNAGRKPKPDKKKFKTFSVLESDFVTFSQLAKFYALSNNALFSLLLDKFKDNLKIK
jgi:hypothetical protein